MPTEVAFLKPTRIKLFFLVEWSLFILATAVRGELESYHQVLVAGYPLIFFYLIACALTPLSQKIQQKAQSWKLLVLAGGLAISDQVIKAIITASVPYHTSIPIVNKWLHLAHVHNPRGSWIAIVFNVQFDSAYNLLQWSLAIPVLFFSILCHRYYINNTRKSLWADVAFIGLFAGYVSWMFEMSLRGYIVDFIHLPGIVTADLKDILITIGVAALFAEMLDNPKLSWRWEGWRKERDDLIRLFTSLYRFAVEELREGWHAIISCFRKTTKLE